MSVVAPKYSKPKTRRTLLAPPAYCETAMPSLRLARSSRFAKGIGNFIITTLVVSLYIVAAAPWQQSVRGTGNVIAYAPLEREQTLESPIRGRLLRLGEGIVENARVREGDLIAEIVDIDPSYMMRLEQQLEEAKNRLAQESVSLNARKQNLIDTKSIVETYEAQVKSYEEIRKQVIAAADAAIAGAKNQLEAANQNLLAQQAALAQVQADFDRQKKLFEENIASELRFQEAERKLAESKANVRTAEERKQAANNFLLEKESERIAREQKAQADIDEKQAQLRKSKGDVANAESSVAVAESTVNSARIALINQETMFERQRSQSVYAPFDGFLTKIFANQGSGILKEGDPLCVIVPDTSDRAVQIWLSGNDAPLVEPGRHVRLQFEGWPAVQFTGWPSVAVGTFGGKIVSVDATDDGRGRFRVLVLPDKTDAAWPTERFLRQGVRANGWVLLNEVPLWYEIWRNLNGFPPVISPDEPGKTASQEMPKLPKLPK